MAQPTKVVLIGQPNVGKTALGMALSHTFQAGQEYDPTIGVSCFQITHDERVYTIWDPSGDPHYDELVDLYCKNVHLFLILARTPDEEAQLRAKIVHRYHPTDQTRIIRITSGDGVQGYVFNPQTGEGATEIMQLIADVTA